MSTATKPAEIVTGDHDHAVAELVAQVVIVHYAERRNHYEGDPALVRAFRLEDDLAWLSDLWSYEDIPVAFRAKKDGHDLRFTLDEVRVKRPCVNGPADFAQYSVEIVS